LPVVVRGEEERIALDLIEAGWLMSCRDDFVAHTTRRAQRGPAGRRQHLITQERPLHRMHASALGVVLSQAGLRAGGLARSDGAAVAFFGHQCDDTGDQS
jgi:hypothetical protein